MPRDNQKPSRATRKRGTYANMKMRLFFNPKDTPWRMKRHKLRNIGRGLKFKINLVCCAWCAEFHQAGVQRRP